MEYVKIVGAPGSVATTQTHEFELSQGSSLFLLVTLRSKETPLSRIEAIRGAVNFLHHEISKGEFDFENFSGSFEKTFTPPMFSAIAAYIKNDIVYLFARGEVVSFLSREGNLQELLKGGDKLCRASGYFKEKDALVLGTNAFFDLVPLEELTPYIIKRNLAALEEDSATRIDKSETRGECALAFLSKKASEQSEQAEFEDEPENVPSDVSQSETVPVSETVAFTGAPSRDFIVRSEDTYEAKSKSKKMAIIGFVLILFLGVSVFFGLQARKQKLEKEAVAKVVTQAQNALAEAKNISPLNKSRARDLIVEARDQVLGVRTEAKYPLLSSIKDALNESLGEVAGIYEITPEVFSDLSLISQGTSADALSLSDNVLRILSRSVQKIITIELPGKRVETLSSGKSLNMRSISGYAKRNFVLADDGVYDVGPISKKQIELPSSADNLLFDAFAGNLYVLERSQNQIYRYNGDGVSFADKKDWLTPGVQIDLSKAKQMGIDSSIWVWSSTGKLTKLTQGNPQTVTLQGIPASPSENSVFYVDSDTTDFYLLDPSQKSIYVFTKTGELIATYVDPLFSQGTSLVVSEENNLIIVGIGSKLLSLPVKHLK